MPTKMPRLFLFRWLQKREKLPGRNSYFDSIFLETQCENAIQVWSFGVISAGSISNFLFVKSHPSMKATILWEFRAPTSQ
jgi:hypothetical protein